MTDDDDRGFMELVGVQVHEAEDGRARLSLAAEARHLNPAGSVHGGVLATLVDVAMGQAVRTATGEEDTPATSQLTVTYLRPGTQGPLEVTAALRKRGEHLSICEADVEQDGETLVHAVATFAVLHG
jgi:uncharacterized protein (TIGR00369 family)